MRIFIALLFDEDNKKKIFSYEKNIERNAISGNFTAYNNLHLTMLFIGQTELDMVLKINEKLKEIRSKQFEYKTGNIKYFQKSRNRKIMYLSLKNTFSLKELYVKIVAKINEIGLDFSMNKFTPHITLGRQVLLPETYDENILKAKELNLRATKISVMESTRINGELIYRELYSIPLI